MAEKTRFVYFFINYAIIVIMFILHLFPDHKALQDGDQQRKGTEKQPLIESLKPVVVGDGEDISATRGVGHKSNKGVDHRSNKGVDHDSNKGVDHKSNKGVDHRSNKGVDHRSNKGVDHDSNKTSGVKVLRDWEDISGIRGVDQTSGRGRQADISSV